MIKTQILEIPASTIKAYKKEVKTYICDFCGYSIKSEGAIYTCSLCEKHACTGRAVGNAKHCMRWDPTEIGDYPDAFCPNCYNLKFGKYRSDLDKIENDYYNAKDALDERIKAESLSLN